MFMVILFKNNLALSSLSDESIITATKQYDYNRIQAITIIWKLFVVPLCYKGLKYSFSNSTIFSLNGDLI